MRTIDLDKLRALLLDSVLKKCRVQELFDNVAECIDMPMICFDVAFAAIAHNFKRPFYYSYWEEIVSKGQSSSENILDLNFLDYQQMMYSNGKSIYFDWGTCEGYPQACGPAIQNGQLVAYTGIMIEDGLSPETAMAANDLLSSAVALVYTREENVKAMSREQMASKALLQSGLSPEFAEEFSATFKPPYVFTELFSEESSVSKFEYIRTLMCSPMSDTIGCLSGEKYLYMLHCNSDSNTVQTISAGLRNICERHNLCAGISDEFDDPQLISTGRTQAALAVSVGRSPELRQRVFTFQDQYTNVVNYCAMELFGVYPCLLPEIESLISLDEGGAVDYLETLEVYLRNFRRTSATAAELRVHKNTVINRMQRIKELLGEDPDSPEMTPRLLTGIAMHRLSRRTDLFPRG